MLENAPADRPPAAPRAPTSRSAITNKPRRMVVSGNTPLGRRLRDLADQLAANLGGWQQLNDLQIAAVRKAAELTALAEDARARRLNGDTSITLDDLVRVDRLAAQAVRQLLDKPPEPAEDPWDFLTLRPQTREPSPAHDEIPDFGTAPAAERNERTSEAVTQPCEPIDGEGEGDNHAGDEEPLERRVERARIGDVLRIGNVQIEIVADDDDEAAL
jgi:hypothetical protein